MSAKKNLLQHSEAKLNLYSKYLSIYLNVLARTFVKRIYLYDLFCGEGIYADGGEGSPIAALNCIKRHHFSNGEKCPNMTIVFNDTEVSEIEPAKKKIERVQEHARNIFIPDNVNVNYTSIDYAEIIDKVINKTAKLNNDERALVFIDPWGYKEINPSDLKKLLANGKTEVILFLPIYFMSRFAEKAKDSEFKGGEALRQFLNELFGSISNLPDYKNQGEFIYLILQEFKKYLGLKYVDSFKIERENNQWFALFFFTSSNKGFWKMLEAKWAVDKKHGAGYKKGDGFALDIFDEMTLSEYDLKLLNYMQQNPGVTNTQLRNFGLENNFLPKHTKEVLIRLRKKHPIQTISLDGKPALSYYLGDETRLVNIKLS